MNMKQSRRELNKIQCRRRILNASRLLFSSDGYDSTTIEAVAAQAEVSKATLYNYFPSKDSLLLGIAEAELNEVHQLLQNELAAVPSAVDKLRRVLRTFVDQSLDCPPLSRKITYLNSCEESDLYAARLEMLQLLRRLAEEGLARGEFRRDVSAGELVDLFMGVYLVAQFQWNDLAGGSDEQRARRLDRFLRLALAGVLV